MNYWILGGGKFGSRAAHILRIRNPRAHITVVDSDSDVICRLERQIDAVQEDGIDFLSNHLERGIRPDWVIAAIPVHVAFEWISRTLGDHQVSRLDASKTLSFFLPNAIRGKRGELYVSLADFICPDHCPEPTDRCFVIGKPRKKEMYLILEDLKLSNYRSIVVRSHQLAPGVGGYTPNALLSAREKIVKTGAPGGRILVSTACRCHAVVHACQIEKQDN